MRSPASQQKRSQFFARKAIKNRAEQKYKEVAPGCWIKTI